MHRSSQLKHQKQIGDIQQKEQIQQNYNIEPTFKGLSYTIGFFSSPAKQTLDNVEEMSLILCASLSIAQCIQTYMYLSPSSFSQQPTSPSLFSFQLTGKPTLRVRLFWVKMISGNYFPPNPHVWLQRKMKFFGNSFPVDQYLLL